MIYLLDNSIGIISSTKAQTDFLEAIAVFKKIISSIKTDVRDQNKEQKKENFCRTRECFK